MHHRQQIPAFMQQVTHVADDVAVTAILGRHQVAGPCIMAEGGKGAADDPAAFTGDQHPHHAASISTSARSTVMLSASAMSASE